MKVKEVIIEKGNERVVYYNNNPIDNFIERIKKIFKKKDEVKKC